MHPEINQMIVIRRTAELRATARTAELVRKARAGRRETALTLASSSSAAAIDSGHARRRQLLGRLVPGWTQSA